MKATANSLATSDLPSTVRQPRSPRTSRPRNEFHSPTRLAAPSYDHSGEIGRREFLQLLGVGALGLALSGCKVFTADRHTAKPLRGIFPIAQTPFTAADKLDLEALVSQLKFIDRGGVQGFVWPQMASEWYSLTEQERFAGMEAIGTTGRRLRPAIVLGVQGPDLAAVRKYIRHAEDVGADAIISLPPSENSDPKTILQYYQDVGRMTELPLFVQAVGNVDVDLLLEMYRTIPTMRYVKDEAGDPLARIGPLREKSHDQIKVFSGGHGRKLIEELGLGFSGSMPAASLADLYATTFDLWHAGKREEAKAMQERTLKALTEMLRYGLEGMKYVLCLRGVFQTYRVRPRPSQGFAGAAAIASGGTKFEPLDEAGKTGLREMMNSLKPWLKA